MEIIQTPSFPIIYLKNFMKMQPARTRVVRNFAIGGTSRPEGRGVGVGGYILGLSHKRGGGNFLKYPLPGRGKFFICLNCLKITDPPLGINNEQSLKLLVKATKYKVNQATDEVRLGNRNHGLA